MGSGLGWGHNVFLIRSDLISFRSLATQGSGVLGFCFFFCSCLEGNIGMALQKCVWGLHARIPVRPSQTVAIMWTFVFGKCITLIITQ